MRKKVVLSIAAGLTLALAIVPSVADQGRGGGPGADRKQQVSQDQRMEMESLRIADIYGHELMTRVELEQYRKRVKELNTVEARERFQIQHEAKMQERARQQGKDLVPPGQGPIYRAELMTVQERNELREQLRAAASEDNRMRLLAQHRDKMDRRAQALDLEKEEAE